MRGLAHPRWLLVDRTREYLEERALKRQSMDAWMRYLQLKEMCDWCLSELRRSQEQVRTHSVNNFFYHADETATRFGFVRPGEAEPALVLRLTPARDTQPGYVELRRNEALETLPAYHVLKNFMHEVARYPLLAAEPGKGSNHPLRSAA